MSSLGELAKMKPKVILTRKLSDSVETRMRELFDAELSSDDQPLSAEQLVELMQRADVLVPTVTDKIDAGMLEQAGANLKLIASFGTGVDHIDLHAAACKSIWSTPVPKEAINFRFAPACSSIPASILSVTVGTRTSARCISSTSCSADNG